MVEMIGIGSEFRVSQRIVRRRNVGAADVRIAFALDAIEIGIAAYRSITCDHDLTFANETP